MMMAHKKLPSKSKAATPTPTTKGRRPKLTTVPSTGSWRTTETAEIKAVHVLTATGERIGWDDEEGEEEDIEEVVPPHPRSKRAAAMEVIDDISESEGDDEDEDIPSQCFRKFGRLKKKVRTDPACCYFSAQWREPQ
jgi:hypothetical protein